MAKCCVCGKEAAVLAHGVWWCEEHYQYVERESEPSSQEDEKAYAGGGQRSRGSVELGLDWM